MANMNWIMLTYKMYTEHWFSIKTNVKYMNNFLMLNTYLNNNQNTLGLTKYTQH